MKNAPKYLTAHRNWSAADFAALAAKGYTGREILALWNRPQQTAPVKQPQIFDAVSYLNR
jgi:hypothetical protein